MTQYAAAMAPVIAWGRIATGLAQLGITASEVIWRRSLLTALGTLSLREAQQMIVEKPATLATATGRAMNVAMRGGHPAAVTAAALRPYRSRTVKNARRLRR